MILADSTEFSSCLCLCTPCNTNSSLFQLLPCCLTALGPGHYKGGGRGRVYFLCWDLTKLVVSLSPRWHQYKTLFFCRKEGAAIRRECTSPISALPLDDRSASHPNQRDFLAVLLLLVRILKIIFPSLPKHITFHRISSVCSL